MISNPGPFAFFGVTGSAGRVSPGHRQCRLPIAANFPAAESDLRTLDSASLRHALGGVAMQLEQDQPPWAETDPSQSRDLGWSLLAMAAGLLVVECFLAMWFRR